MKELLTLAALIVLLCLCCCANSSEPQSHTGLKFKASDIKGLPITVYVGGKNIGKISDTISTLKYVRENNESAVSAVFLVAGEEPFFFEINYIESKIWLIDLHFLVNFGVFIVDDQTYKIGK